MKILFLDHDGVICLHTEWGGRFENKEGLDSVFDRFNQGAVDILNEIIEATDCEIVTSSDWRHHCTLEEMQELFKVRGIKKGPIAFTDFVPSSAWFLEKARVREINNFLLKLEEEGKKVDKWCAVDDMDLSELENFVRTDSMDGLKEKGAKEKIIEILNK